MHTWHGHALGGGGRSAAGGDDRSGFTQESGLAKNVLRSTLQAQAPGMVMRWRGVVGVLPGGARLLWLVARPWEYWNAGLDLRRVSGVEFRVEG